MQKLKNKRLFSLVIAFAVIATLSAGCFAVVFSHFAFAENDTYIIEEISEVEAYVALGDDYSLPTSVIGYGVCEAEDGSDEYPKMSDGISLAVEWENQADTSKRGLQIINGRVVDQTVDGHPCKIQSSAAKVAAKIHVGEAVDYSGLFTYDYKDYFGADENLQILPLVSADGQIKIDSPHRPLISYNIASDNGERYLDRASLLYVQSQYVTHALEISLPKNTTGAKIIVRAFNIARTKRNVQIVDENESVIASGEISPTEIGTQPTVGADGIEGVPTVELTADIASGGAYYLNCSGSVYVYGVEIIIDKGQIVKSFNDDVTIFTEDVLPTEYVVENAPEGYDFFGWLNQDFKSVDYSMPVPAGTYRAVYGRLEFLRAEAVPSGSAVKMRFAFGAEFFGEDYIDAILGGDSPLVTIYSEMTNAALGATRTVQLNNYVVNGGKVSFSVALDGMGKAALDVGILCNSELRFNGETITKTKVKQYYTLREIINFELENNPYDLSEEDLEFLRNFIA